MLSWESRLWKRWITNVLERPEARRLCGRSVRRRTVGRSSQRLENLEDRLVPALVSLSSVVTDDFATTNSNAPVTVDVLANDVDSDGMLDALSLMVGTGPLHGTARVQQTLLGFGDDGSPVGDGFGSALSGEVDADGSIDLVVSGLLDGDFTGAHDQSGDYALFVRLGKSDFSNFDAGVFDFPFTDSLSPGEVDWFRIPGQTAGTPFMAWIDNTVGSGAPDTVLGLLGTPAGILYSPDPGFDGTDSFTYTVQDNEGQVSNAATVTVTVINQPPVANDDSASTAKNTPVVIDVLGNDNDPEGPLDFSALTITSAPARGTVSLQPVHADPDDPGSPVVSMAVLYTPDPSLGAELVVDDPVDRNDGNYSPGHLSLREAIFLSSNYTDQFRYRVGDDDGVSSNEAIVSVAVGSIPTTIRFAPSLTARRPVTLSFSLVGDTTSDNSAFAINSQVTIVGAADRSRITLRGTGPTGDLRLFRVLAGGHLTLEGLTMTNWATDTNGSVLAVDPVGFATITNCNFSNNSAHSQGGAIFMSLGGELLPPVSVMNSTFSNNRAHDGGAFNGGGQTFGQRSANFLNCIFRENTAVDRGGAIALYNAAATLTDCTLENNTAHQGGGIAGGGVFLTHSTFIGNRATDGGSLFVGIGGGDTNGSILEVGGPGGVSSLLVDSCTFTNNSAMHRGGALFIVVNSLASEITSSTFTRNRAQQGGGIFLDSSELSFLTKLLPEPIQPTVFASNIATMGGGIFVRNGHIPVENYSFTNNAARQGAAIYNDLGFVEVSDTVVRKNASSQGAQIFNHLGTVSLTNSTLEDFSKLKFLTTGNRSLTRFLAQDLRPQPAVVSAPPRDAIVTAPDGIRYALTRDHLLLRQIPNSNWSILDDLVVSFKIAPNGDCYWLNERGDLLRFRAADGPDLIGQHVRGLVMDQHGTVYDLSDGAGPGNFAAYASLTAPLLDPVVEHDDPSNDFCLDPPTPEEVIQALGLRGTNIRDLRIVVEPKVDRIDSPRYFPNIGLARMHHCHYKCTVYYSTELNGDLVGVIYLDRDHLSRFVPGQDSARHAANRPRVAADMAASIATVSDPTRSDNIHSLWTGPDGTIYRLGGDYNGFHLVGQPPVPLVLWKLPPGGNWESPLLNRVYSAAVALDNTLFVLNQFHELQRLVAGATQWTTVASDVQSFTMTQDGVVYALDANGRLIREQRVPRSVQRTLTTLATGVQSYAATSDGVLFALNNRNELHRFTGNSTRSVRIETKVTTLQQAADGSIYTLNPSGQLKRFGNPPKPAGARIPMETWAAPQRLISSAIARWSVIGTAIESFQLDPDGVVYALNRRHELLRSTHGFHWSLIDTDVQSFLVAPNGLRNVYTLTTNHDLKRLEAGYDWRILRTDAVSISLDAEGIITAHDTLGRSWMYWSPFTVPALDSIGGDNPLFVCPNPPTPEDVLRLTHIPDGPDVTVVVEVKVDGVDPPRWFSNLGQIPAVRLHHCHYHCTVYYPTANGLQTLVIDIDTDHLIRSAGPDA